VAIVSGDFVKTGGMDRANYALANFLSVSGCPVEVVAHRIDPELAALPSVRFRRVAKPLSSQTLSEPLLDFAGRRAAKAARALGGVAVVNGGNCLGGEVNWAHYVHAAYRPPLPSDRRGALRWLEGVRARRRERVAFSRARLVIANSAATRRVLVDELGVAAERAFVVYYGIDAQEFAPTDADGAKSARQELGWPERPTVAFVGALADRRKGFDTVFAAWQKLARDPAWDAHLVAIGAGAELSSWRERVAAEGLAARVRLLGFRSDVPRLLSACDALVAPTRYEAFGLGVAEALAMGLPALVSAAAGVAELYPAELRHLLLADAESSDELVARLYRWREQSERERSLVGPLSAKVRARSWDDMASEIVALIERFTP
jgi:glycosyltransferase involved in cell wall biosynthesis